MTDVACFAAGLWRSARDNNIDLEPDKLGRDFGEALDASLRPAILDRDGATLDPAEFAQPLHKSGDPLALREGVLPTKKPDRRHCRLLRPRRERPRRRRAAEQRDELAPLVAVGTCISWHAPRPDPYVRLSRIRLLPRVCDGTSCRIRSSACDTRAWF